MNPIASTLMLSGASLAVIASLGLHRFVTSSARFHAAGKASPISFFLIAAGVGIEIGLAGGVQLAVASIALAITLPASTHLLFRAVHRTRPDRLASVEAPTPHEGPDREGDNT